MMSLQPSTTRIGQTDTTVYRVGLGGWPLSASGRPSEKQALKVIHAFVELGGEWIDTANSYCMDHRDFGHNEMLIQKALASLPNQKVKVATKVGTLRPSGEWRYDAKPESIQAQCEDSLKRLQVESIFLYQLHAVDPSVPFSETLGALKALQTQGKIQHIGLSNVTQAQLEEAMQLVTVCSVQNRCNPMHQHDLKNGMVDWCAKHHITYIPYSPMGGKEGQIKLCSHPVLQQIAEKHNTNIHGVALAWLLHKGSHILPLAGASKVVNIKNSVRAIKIHLDNDDIQQIDDVQFVEYYL